VDVTFGDDDLRRCYEDHKRATRRWGQKIARRYVDRINRLQASQTANDLRSFPELRLHPLTGDRKGQWALNLDSAWRLIVVFLDQGMKVVRVDEVSDHYED
jgi:toxin HigB-1